MELENPYPNIPWDRIPEGAREHVRDALDYGPPLPGDPKEVADLKSAIVAVLALTFRALADEGPSLHTLPTSALERMILRDGA